MLKVILLSRNWASWITKRGTKSSEVSGMQVGRSRMKLDLPVRQGLSLLFFVYLLYSFLLLLTTLLYICFSYVLLCNNYAWTYWLQTTTTVWYPSEVWAEWALLSSSSALCGIGWGCSYPRAQMNWNPQGDSLPGQAEDVGSRMGVQPARQLEYLSSLLCSVSQWGLGFPQHGGWLWGRSVTNVQKQKLPGPLRPGRRSPSWLLPLHSIGQSSHGASFSERGNRLDL